MGTPYYNYSQAAMVVYHKYYQMSKPVSYCSKLAKST